jgi:hypothetical protein
MGSSRGPGLQRFAPLRVVWLRVWEFWGRVWNSHQTLLTRLLWLDGPGPTPMRKGDDSFGAKTYVFAESLPPSFDNPPVISIGFDVLALA